MSLGEKSALIIPKLIFLIRVNTLKSKKRLDIYYTNKTKTI